MKFKTKISKEAAHYVDSAKKEHCQDCDMYINHSLHGCTLVMGWISSKGHCRHWEAKNKLPVEEKKS